MLKKLDIQNYAIIDKLTIGFVDGLTIITGETGAGKSILLGALGLIMGKRADTKVLYNQEVKCFVEATFDVSDYSLKPIFEEEELDYYDELIIRREISTSGKTRAFVNDTPVTLDVLQKISDHLIDIHQQFDTLEIQKPAFQTEVVDMLAGNKDILEEYTDKYRTYRQISRSLDEAIEKNRTAQQEIEFLNFQMKEFEEISLKSGELDELESRLQILTSSEDIKNIHALLVHGLEEDEASIINALQSMINEYSSIKKLDSQYAILYDRLLAIREELSDVTRESASISESTEYSEEEIELTTQRLNAINRLLKKHNVLTDGDLIEIEASIQNKLSEFSDMTSSIDKLKTEKEKLHKQLTGLAAKLSKNRKSITSKFEKDVQDLLVSLSMENARIKVSITTADQLTPTGSDEISLLFAPNKGSEFLPIKDTASGGELSRLTLCIKSLIAETMTWPTLIFDEIDSGVSGEVAKKIGDILFGLSETHQVICVTHSPQVAAKAQSHYWVFKEDSGTRTTTGMKKLSSDERVLEIAKMLSGNPPSEAAIANARELIGIQNL